MLKTRWLILPLLIALVILPRLSIDFMLPALIDIGNSLEASDEALRMTLTIFMFGYALSMLIAGPLSDIIGRKRVLCYGLAIYMVATLACALTSSIHFLIFGRFFQALGGCCGTVIARVMVKDGYTKKNQIRILAHLSAAMAICPLFIPVIGGLMQIYFGWRVGFYILFVFATALLLLSKKEIVSLTPIKHDSFSLKRFSNYYCTLLTHRLFLGYSLAIGFAWCNYFAFTLESSFLLQKTLGFDAIHYGILFSITIVGYLIGTQLAKRFANQVGWDKLIFIATMLCLIGAVTSLNLVVFLPLNAITLILPMTLVMIGVGIIIPCTQAAVMQPFPHIAGTSSGLFFFIQMLFGGVCGLILQSFQHNTALPMSLTLLISSLLLTFSFYILIWNTKEKGTPNDTQLVYSKT